MKPKSKKSPKKSKPLTGVAAWRAVAPDDEVWVKTVAPYFSRRYDAADFNLGRTYRAWCSFIRRKVNVGLAPQHAVRLFDHEQNMIF